MTLMKKAFFEGTGKIHADAFLAESYLRDIKDNALVLGGLKELSKEGSVWSGLFSGVH